MYTIAVAGNPNAGKTTLFNALSGTKQTVGNYPGVTVEKKEGEFTFENEDYKVVDLPGTYSLTAYSQEEIVARNYIIDEHPNAVLDVVDASNLERNLYLTLQLAEMGVPVIVALNMHDIALQRGIRVDMSKLSNLLGMPVVATIGHKNEVKNEIIKTIRDSRENIEPLKISQINYGLTIEQQIKCLSRRIENDKGIKGRHPSRWLAIKLLEEDQCSIDRIMKEAEAPTQILDAAQKCVALIERKENDDVATLIVEKRYGHAAGVVRECVIFEDKGATVTDAVDTIVCNRFLGFLFVALAVFVTFKLTFFLAEDFSFIPWNGEWLSAVGWFEWLFGDWLPSLIEPMSDGPLKSLLLDGIIAGVGGVMGFVPLIFFMFFMLAIIEDSGYIARIAFVLDRVLRMFGLQGKSIMALIVSGGIAGGCAVPGVMATRTLREEKDRLTTMLVVPFMNCGAKMPVYAMLISAFFAAHKGEMMWLLASISWIVTLFAALFLRKFVIRGEQTPFVMELPPYHIPHFGGVLRSALQRSWLYLKKAGTVILGVSILLWAMMYFPRMDTAKFDKQKNSAAVNLIESLKDTPVYIDRFKAEGFENMIASLNDLKAKGEKKSSFEKSVEEKYNTYLESIAETEARQRGMQLKQSAAGRIGFFLEPVSKLAGFDWKDNIALIGGFAAKEIIVSTMSMTYTIENRDVSLSEAGAANSPETETKENSGIVNILKSSPGWSMLRAFSLMIFVMLYAPCIVTVAVIWRESGSWKWALFSTAYSTAIAFALAVSVYQIGGALGIGVN